MAVALGSDYNPSCPVESMSLVLSLACYSCHLSPAEALCAATFNAAWAVGLGEEVGSLEPGKQADLVVWEVSNHKQLAERLGGRLAAVVVRKGRVFEG
jgi:imidazolonepropionase